MFGMKPFQWSDEKEALLLSHPDRGGIGFADCAEAILGGGLLATVPNPSANHPDQGMYVVNIGGYAYCVPFLETETYIFLKTVYPSRRYRAQYLERRQ